MKICRQPVEKEIRPAVVSVSSASWRRITPGARSSLQPKREESLADAADRMTRKLEADGLS